MKAEIKRRLKIALSDIENEMYDDAAVKLIAINNSASRIKLFSILENIKEYAN